MAKKKPKPKKKESKFILVNDMEIELDDSGSESEEDEASTPLSGSFMSTSTRTTREFTTTTTKTISSITMITTTTSCEILQFLRVSSRLCQLIIAIGFSTSFAFIIGIAYNSLRPLLLHEVEVVSTSRRILLHLLLLQVAEG